MDKLKVEESEALSDVLQHPGYKVLLKLLGACAQRMNLDVLNLTLSKDNHSELIAKKCRAEGAAQLLAAFQTRIQGHKARQEAAAD